MVCIRVCLLDQKYNRARCMSEVYDALKSLFWEIGAPNVSLGASQLQIMDGMSCWQDEIPGTTALCQSAFANKP